MAALAAIVRSLVWLALTATAAAQTQYYVYTLAGTASTAGYAGDGGAATSARLSTPNGIAQLSTGSFVIAERSNHIIRRVDAAGIITTIAGVSGSAGYSGDGGAATAAQLSQPYGVAAFGTAEFLVADTANTVIRRVDASGVISTIAGVGQSGGFSGDGGAATSAKLLAPVAVAADSTGGFFIADQQNHAIRRVDAAGIISTVAGKGGVYGFSGDGGPATSALLDSPTSVTLDGAGGFYIADLNNNVVRRVNAAGVISRVAGNTGGSPGFAGDNGPATSATLNGPSSVISDGAAGFILADTFNGAVRSVSAAGAITTVAGRGSSSNDGVPATTAMLMGPIGVHVDSSGTVYVVERSAHRIRVLTTAAPASATASASVTSTRAPTTSSSRVATISLSPTVSASSSVAASPSMSVKASTSVTPSTSVTASTSVTPSTSVTASMSATASTSAAVTVGTAGVSASASGQSMINGAVLASSPSSTSNSASAGVIAALVLACIAFTVTTCIIFVVACRRRRKQRRDESASAASAPAAPQLQLREPTSATQPSVSASGTV